MRKTIKKVLGVVSAAAMTLTSFAGASASSLTDANILMTDQTVDGGSTYIKTFYKPEYFAKSGFKVAYEYEKLDEDGKVTVDGEVQDVDYTDTLDFKVFNMEWGGWEATAVGEAKPELNKTYTATVSIADIEEKLGSGTVQGINFETGAIGDAKVKVVSLEYVNDGNMKGASATFEGEYTKGEGGKKTLAKTAGSGNITMNDWNIQISDICAYGFKFPTVDVTVEYTSAPNDYVQAEILAGTGDSAKAIVPYFPKVTKAGTVTYTTEFNANLTAMTLCYDSCIVKKIHIYDNTAGDKEVSVTGKTADEIATDMGVAWNLGNALDAISEDGKVNEQAWNEAVTTKKLIQAVKGQEFNTVRIPVSFLDKINSDGTVDSEYLARIQQVVDYAYSQGMFAVIDMHNDGGEVANKWLDITKTGAEFDAIKTKFAAVWTDIATYFRAYDQKLVFEGFNELMNGNYNAAPQQYQLDNVNALAQAFVTAVRSAGGKNDDRVLIVAGYNTNIQETINGFVKPTDTESDRLMLSVHYYDPYNFTLNENSGENTWGTDEQKQAMATAIDDIALFAMSEGMPVFIGEYGPIDKNNIEARKAYCYELNYCAKNNGVANVVTAYWDNGVVGTNGSALFDRVNNVVTATGEKIVSAIRNGAGF